MQNQFQAVQNLQKMQQKPGCDAQMAAFIKQEKNATLLMDEIAK